MSVVFYLLPLAIMLALVGLAGFFWAVSNGQFDDLEGPRWRVLFEAEPQVQDRRQGVENG